MNLLDAIVSEMFDWMETAEYAGVLDGVLDAMFETALHGLERELSADDEAGCTVRIQVQMPGGSRSTTRVRKNATVGAIFGFAESLLPERATWESVQRVERISSESLGVQLARFDAKQSVADAGLSPSAAVVAKVTSRDVVELPAIPREELNFVKLMVPTSGAVRRAISALGRAEQPASSMFGSPEQLQQLQLQQQPAAADRPADVVELRKAHWDHHAVNDIDRHLARSATMDEFVELVLAHVRSGADGAGQPGR